MTEAHAYQERTLRSRTVWEVGQAYDRVLPRHRNGQAQPDTLSGPEGTVYRIGRSHGGAYTLRVEAAGRPPAGYELARVLSVQATADELRAFTPTARTFALTCWWEPHTVPMILHSQVDRQPPQLKSGQLVPPAALKMVTKHFQGLNAATPFL